MTAAVYAARKHIDAFFLSKDREGELSGQQVQRNIEAFNKEEKDGLIF